MHRSEEDYIKEIYKLSQVEEEYVGNQHLAEALSHSLQTVSEMVKKLDKQGYIQYTPYKGSKLLEKGRKAAIRLVRIHRTWEYFLVNQLNYSWEQVHEEAEKLEHVTSDLLDERLYHYLKEPKLSPLGSPIPDLAGNVADRSGIRLWDAKTALDYVVIRVSADSELLRYLSSFNISINQTITVSSIDRTGELIHLKVGDRNLVLSKKTALSVYIKEGKAE